MPRKKTKKCCHHKHGGSVWSTAKKTWMTVDKYSQPLLFVMNTAFAGDIRDRQFQTSNRYSDVVGAPEPEFTLPSSSTNYKTPINIRFASEQDIADYDLNPRTLLPKNIASKQSVLDVQKYNAYHQDDAILDEMIDLVTNTQNRLINT